MFLRQILFYIKNLFIKLLTSTSDKALIRGKHVNWVGCFENMCWDISRQLVAYKALEKIDVKHYLSLERLSALTEGVSGIGYGHEFDWSVIKTNDRLHTELCNFFVAEVDSFRYDTELYLLFTKLFRDMCVADLDKDVTPTEEALSVLAGYVSLLRYTDNYINQNLTFGYINKSGYNGPYTDIFLKRDIGRVYRTAYHYAEKEAPLDTLILLNALGCVMTLRYRLRYVLAEKEYTWLRNDLSELITHLTTWSN